MAHITEYDFGISAIDSMFQRPLMAAIHLIVERGRAAIVDTATNHSVPVVLEALRDKGIAPEQVDYVVLTHIHLDHAGGAGLLMSRLPNARLTVHPRGTRHMVDPVRLVEGTVAVYGEAVTRRMYGDILPIARERIIETGDGASIDLNGRRLEFHDTPGHARHHVCIRDTVSGHIFAGDTFGLSWRELDRDGRQFVFPTTSPVQFDPVAAHATVDRLLSLQPPAIYVTHYSQVRDIVRLGADMHRLIDAHERLGRDARNAGGERSAQLEVGVRELVLQEATRQAWPVARAKVLELFATDIELNAQGLGCWLDSLDRAR